MEFESLVPRKAPVPVMDQGKWGVTNSFDGDRSFPPEEKADGLNTCVERWQGWQGIQEWLDGPGTKGKVRPQSSHVPSPMAEP
jgi:hypothetical protein